MFNPRRSTVTKSQLKAFNDARNTVRSAQGSPLVNAFVALLTVAQEDIKTNLCAHTLPMDRTEYLRGGFAFAESMRHEILASLPGGSPDEGDEE